MSLITQKNEARELPSDFLQLQEALIELRPIHSKKAYNTAITIASDLASRKKLIASQLDFLNVLTTIIKQYEDSRVELSRHNPREMLKYLVEENNMSGSDLGRLLGQRTLGPKLLNGERQLSKTHIRILTERFKVHADLFI